MESTTTLLSMLDDAKEQHGLSFNGAVMRKALKSLVNQDVQVQAFERLVTVTRDIILKRFVPEEEVFADDFYIIMCSQTFQKLFKLGASKFKTKDLWG